MSIPEVGEPAPAFSLAGTVVRDGTRTDGVYDLSAQIGRTVVLAFYPGDATPVCSAQLCSYQEELDDFDDLGAVVWGISPQALDSHEAFARGSSLTFPLLSDPSGAVVRSYGVRAPGSVSVGRSSSSDRTASCAGGTSVSSGCGSRRPRSSASRSSNSSPDGVSISGISQPGVLTPERGSGDHWWNERST